jgi:hypothetical protein
MDWIDGHETVSLLGDVAPIRDLERECPESEYRESEYLEPDLHFGVFNAMHLPV